jgi:hypothetical protein
VGKVPREARFKVVSDAELQVTAPVCLRGGASAILAISSENGATVCIPASVRDVEQMESGSLGDAALCHVLNHGVAMEPTGIVLVEEGGVSRAPDAMPIAFVHKGGVLYDAERFSGLLVYEPGAVIKGDSRHRSPFRPIQVPAITASVGVEPFVYHRPNTFDGAATAPPVVQALRPELSQPGDILTLTGTGLSESTEVLFVSDGLGGRAPQTAGFRVVSDGELEVELPDNSRGSGYLIVVNPKGATLVASRSDVAPYISARDRVQMRVSRGAGGGGHSLERPLIRVGAQSVVSDGGGSAIYFVDQGGLIARTGGSCLFFVKSGGRVSFGGSGGQQVFYETGAEVEGNTHGRKSESFREVDSLSVSLVRQKLQIAAQ